MSIAIVLSSLCAEGTPILALEMAKVWRRRGVDFKVCTFLDSPLDMADEFRAAGIEVDHLSVNFRGYIKFPDLVRHTYLYCRRNRFDAVLSFPFGWHSYVVWGARLAGVRRVVAHAGCYPPVSDTSGIQKLRMTVRFGDVWHPTIACCSNRVRAGVAEYLTSPGIPLRTIYNGIDLNRFAPCRRRSQKLEGVLKLGMVARFDRDQPTLIHAARILHTRGIEVQVDLVGFGPRQSEFERLASDLQIRKQIRFLGMRRDIPELLEQWDLFVFAVTPSEGLGVALIEALASGVPVIASDVGACREVLTCPQYGTLGEFFPAGDAEQLANAIVRFKADPEPWWTRAQRATASVRRRFSIETMADEYLRLLRER